MAITMFRMKRLLITGLLLTSGCKMLPKQYFRETEQVHRLIHYTRDKEGEDHWQSPEETLERRRGDCEDMAFLLQDRLKQRGYDSVVRIGRRTQDSELHAWVEVHTNNARYVLEPTSGRVIKNPSGYITWDSSRENK